MITLVQTEKLSQLKLSTHREFRISRVFNGPYTNLRLTVQV